MRLTQAHKEWQCRICGRVIRFAEMCWGDGGGGDATRVCKQCYAAVKKRWRRG